MSPRRAAALALLTGGWMACVSDRPGTGPEPVEGTEVSIENFAYVPPALTVPAGATVTWTNGDEAPHTVTADDGESFTSGVLGSGRTFELVAPGPGTYEYHCEVHPFMTGSLTVTGP